MSQDEAIGMFSDVEAIYRAYLPKLKKLINEYGYGGEFLPGDDPETYSHLYQRESAHFEAIYNEDQWDALHESSHTQKYFEDAYHGFFNDYEEVSTLASHIDHVLESLQ